MIKREDFINIMASKGYTKTACGEILNDFLGTIEELLVQGESVMFRGFGTFDVRERAARPGKNTYGEDVEVPAINVVHFSPGKLLKREVRTGVLEPKGLK